MALTIFFPDAGTFTIDDDGIRGNNTSVIRDSTGAVILTFSHPADAITFTALTAGVNFVFNTADSFGSANVTVGSLTNPADNPDSIVVNNVSTNGALTLVSNGSITEFGADAAADLIGGSIVLSAASGIGTPANAIETNSFFIEGETNTGGISLANFGQVQIGGITANVNGLDVLNSGDINFSSTGTIFINDTSGPVPIHGGNLSGNVTLTSIGAISDIYAPANTKMINAPGGGITLNAGRDVLIGIGGANFDNDLLATNFVTIHAGNDVIIDGNSNIRTGAFGGVVGGDILIQAGHDIRLTNTTGGLQTIEAFQGNVTLMTGPGGTFIENAAFPGAIQTTADILLVADVVLINSGGLNTTGIGQITIRPATAGRAINIGSAIDITGALSLSDAEIDKLFSLNLVIGDENSGNVEFSAPITPFVAQNLTVRSGGEILVASNISLSEALILRGDSIYQLAAAGISVGSFQAFVDSPDTDPGFGGVAGFGTTIDSTSITISGNGDADTLNGSGSNDAINGNAGNDILRGFGGNDTLNGGLGADAMTGGPGDDFFFVDNAGDTVFETVGEGNDRVFAGLSYALAAGQSVEIIGPTDQMATTAINFTGNAFAQTIVGNAGANSLDSGGGGDVMIGLGGDDFYFVRSSADRAVEGAGAGTDSVFAAVNFVLEAGSAVEVLRTIDQAATTAINLTGNTLTQTIVGNAGANNLDSGGGGDVMIGLGGNDFYFIRAAGDRAVEATAAGSDRVFAAVSFTLEAGSEVEMITTTDNAGTSAINLTGNALAQAIYGNAGANSLDGGGGGDTMVGFGGNDFYFIRNVFDRAVEAAAGGSDRIFAAVSFTLEAGSEVEIVGTIDQAATTAINLTGNALVQTIVGNAGANSLDSGGAGGGGGGGGGGDTMIGLGGDDFYFVRNGGDRAVESAGGGNDRVFAAVSFTLEAGSQVEMITTDFNGGAGAINLTGNELAQAIFGNAGANVVDGRNGLDTLTGFGGADTFAFTTAMGAGNVDQVTDMQAGVDKIALDDAVFTGLAPGALPAGAFVIGTAAADADDRIIYNNATGALLFDADGNDAGAAVQFATLQGLPVISAGDFVVI